MREYSNKTTSVNNSLPLSSLLWFSGSLTMMDAYNNPSAVESGDAAVKSVDDDGREKRTGTFWTASAHIITAVIGSGVLSLAWAIAQLGWVAGTTVLVAFAIITYYTSTLLADCYRSPDSITGTRNYNYMGVVRSYLGMDSYKQIHFVSLSALFFTDFSVF